MGFARWSAVVALVCTGAAAAAAQGGVTVSGVLSAPFSNGLVASPAGARVAWVTDSEGRRNIWVAGSGEAARQVTHFATDDGQDIDALAWSPDGEQLAFTRGTGAQGPEHPVANPAELPGPVHQTVSVVDLAAGTLRFVAQGHSPLFSRDGRSLLYVRDGNVWIANLRQAPTRHGQAAASTPGDPPETHQLLFVRGTSGGLRLSPDGTRLLFVSSRGDHSFVAVYTFATRELGWMDPGVSLDHDPVWSPDGAAVAFVREVPIVSPIADRWLREGAPWSIRLASPTTGEGRELWHADAGSGSLFHAVTAADQLLWMSGGRIVFPWEKDGWTHLYALPAGPAAAPQLNVSLPLFAPLRAPLPIPLTPGEYEVDSVAGSRTTLLFSANNPSSDPADADRRHLWAVDADGRELPRALTRGTGIQTSPALLSDGTVVALAGGTGQPLVPTAVDGAGGLRPLAPGLVPASFPAERFVVPRPVVFAAADGMAIHGQLFLPPGAAPGARLPAVVFFHGGSRRQMLLGFHPMQYYAQAYEFNQLLAAEGFAVLSVNYRSGTGYGLNFRQALHYGANGASEYNDVVGAAHYLRSRPEIDPRRIGAWGGSYGGYLTALALARSSDLYAAGVDLHGVHDWSLELELWQPTSEPGADRAATVRTALRSSPISDIDRWKSPVLLIQGDDDRNVLFAQTVRLAADLRARHVTVETLVFPDEVHDFLLHRSWMLAYGRSLRFLRSTLQ